MPFTIGAHSMVQYDEKTIYIIGGVQNELTSNKTWIVDPTKEFQIREGPSLNEKRYRHCCAKMTLNGKTVLVVAGGGNHNENHYNSRTENLDSVEILDPTGNNIWTKGPNLPMKLIEMTMVTSPSGKGVIVMGVKALFELSESSELSESLEWVTLEQTLEQSRNFIVVPISDDLVYEKVQVKKQ